MAPPPIQSADNPHCVIANYTFDVDLRTGLNDTHLQDLADLFRNHADSRQLHQMLRELRELLLQQRTI